MSNVGVVWGGGGGGNIFLVFYAISNISRKKNSGNKKPLLMEILHFEDLGDTSVIIECSLGDNLVIDNFLYVASCSFRYFTSV